MSALLSNLRCKPLLAAAALVLLVGCTDPIETDYGRRQGESVAGTAVLAEMFADAGHRVTSWRVLSPRLFEADVIVWAPDRFQPPEEETVAWLEQWLDENPDGTLIYIGRDYDAATDYWQSVLPQAPAPQAREIRSELTAAKLEHNSRRSVLKTSQESDWFTVQAKTKPQAIEKLRGPWSEGIDAKRAAIKLRSPIEVPDEAEVLLAAGDEVLVASEQDEWEESGQLIVVANGSFLLNLPLVNHEHRKLAGKLVSAAGPPGDVVFLESDEEAPEILPEDPASEMPTGMEIFAVWPLNFILLHLALLGIIFAFARAPIFGIPRRLPAPPLSDFARHVAALGDLLKKTHDRKYAQTQLQHYHQLVHSEGKPRAAQAATTPPPQATNSSPSDS